MPGFSVALGVTPPQMMRKGKMKQCPKCNEIYDDSWGICHKDSEKLDDFQAPVNDTNPTSPTAQCPFCKELIIRGAIKCKHCGEFLNTKPETKNDYECPHCKKRIDPGASRCPFCREELGVMGLLSNISALCYSLAMLAGAIVVLLYFFPDWEVSQFLGGVIVKLFNIKHIGPP